eukprot:1175730-Prorocentrum_minimum.AAC.6
MREAEEAPKDGVEIPAETAQEGITVPTQTGESQVNECPEGALARESDTPASSEAQRAGEMEAEPADKPPHKKVKRGITSDDYFDGSNPLKYIEGETYPKVSLAKIIFTCLALLSRNAHLRPSRPPLDPVGN